MACRSAREMAKGGKANWMADAVKPSKKGVFAAKAKRAGKSTSAYAKEKASAPGTLGKEARLAQTFAKMRPKKHAKGGAVHDDAPQDRKLIASMIKAEEKKDKSEMMKKANGGPIKLAAGGVAKARQGAMSMSGQQKKQTAPMRSPIGRVSKPRGVRGII